MMGAEPLEVPSTPTDNHFHHNNNSSLIHPSGLSDDASSPLHNNNNNNNSGANNNLGQSSTSSSAPTTNKGPRRTRHRVDAGEPRGCFNTSANQFSFQPRNIFTSPSRSHHHHHHHQQGVGVALPHPQISPYHHPSPGSLFSPYANSQGVVNFPHQNQQKGGNQLSQDSYYFQPMKMLSEFITSQQAQAAAQAAVAATTTSPSTNNNMSTANGHVVSSQQHQQMLLREMLSKSGGGIGGGSENNNNVTKCGYEEEVKRMVRSDEEFSDEERASATGPLLTNSINKQAINITTNTNNNKDNSVPNQNTPLELTNGHSEVDSVKSQESDNTAKGMRINGCKKRKLYQPQQRSDFDEHDDEELEDEDYDAAVLAEAAARSSKRLKESSTSPSSSPIPPHRMPLEILMVTSSQEEDEEEEMQRMMLKSDQHDCDDDQFIVNDDDDDGDEDIVNSSNRTTPNHHHHNNNNMSKDNAATAAPLTRQLLTERKEHTRKGSPLSILRSSSSPKLLSNGLNQGINLRRRSPQESPFALDAQNNNMVQLPFGAGIGPNPAQYFYQWKENFKSSLISQITDLVDNQFSLLFPPQNSPFGQKTSNSHSTPAQPQQHHQQQHHQTQKPLQSKNPSSGSLLLNGGTMSNNINNNNNNNTTRGDISPPPEKMPRMTIGQNKGDFFPRYPFQVSGNIPRELQAGPNGSNNNPNIKNSQHGGTHGQNFSTALMGLSQAAQLQHHQQQAALNAAHAAAMNAAEMFENDSPLSLVVSRGGGGLDNTPRKKRHKVTDTRLTPRAVSRLLGNVDQYGGDLSPQRGEGRTPPPSSGGLPSNQSSLGSSLPTTVAIPNPSLSDNARLFNPYGHPLFAHHAAQHGGLNRLGSSPPMGASLIHPAILANSAEYVQQLRDLNEAHRSMNGERDRERRDSSSGRNEHVRAVRDSGTMLPTLSRDGRGGIDKNERPGSVGSDSGETGSFDGGLQGSLYSCGTSHSASSTLTPMHLRKAKLMFFWVRYPSSSVIKMYFPDIKFNKNNTAQLVKWFSNFREFYYIQMEKYARQALSEGIKNAEDLHVTIENELYRVLNLHYNRNNHIEVPTNFRYVVEQTLREFFKAIQQGKDQEQSWKKAIYKIIARLDDPVPEYFKSPNFLEQLE